MMRILCLLLVLISFPGLGQERIMNMDSMRQVMENRRKAHQIYLKNLAENPKETLDSVYHKNREMHAQRGIERLHELESNTRLDTLKVLNLSYAGLKEIPPFVYGAINIEMLVLDYNDIKRLPKKLSSLKNLKHISWSNNGLDDYWWIRIGNLDQIETLNLSDNTLKRIPVGIGKLDSLKTLILDRNLFEAFPVKRLARNEHIKKLMMNRCAWMKIQEADYEKLKFIEELHLNHCDLTSIDPSFYQMTGISELQLKSNKLKNLPEGISDLIDLSKLSMYKNDLEALPKDFYDLKNLEIVDLYYNKLQVIAPELGQLSKLKVLYLAHNELYDIPESIGELDGLMELYLHHNKFSVLPEGISKLKNLQVIRVNDNYLMEFPEQVLELNHLKDLDVSNNQLSSIPVDVSGLAALKLFSYNGNEVDFDALENQNLAVVIHKMIERGVICVPKVSIEKPQ